MTRSAALLVVLLALLAAGSPPAARSETLFRPLAADVRENLLRLQFVSFSQDFRYGSDVTDSTSRGGVENDVRGTDFEVGAARTFLAAPAERLLGWRGPWQRWQLGVPAGVFAGFQRVEVQLVNVVDYQFGVSLDARWTGDEENDELAGFDRPVLTTRAALYHRSSHVGDEYVTWGRFGRNQEGLDSTGLFRHPPVKRVIVSYEAFRTLASLEWAPFPGRTATMRLYGGTEFKVPISRREPRAMSSPVMQLGAELRSAGNAPDVAPPRWIAPINRILGSHAITASWFAAVDLRLARPFDFASANNADGTGERWTPNLYTPADHGSEGPYAGSWHGMAGLSLAHADRRDRSRGGRRTAPEVLLTLDWYRGYSPFGPFSDMRYRYHPRWYVLPSLTVQLW